MRSCRSNLFPGDATTPHDDSIEWTDTTWNPVTGCTEITRDCDNCYARRLSERFRGTPGDPFENGFDLTLRPERLQQPLSWKRPRMIFVNSMSDLFHKQIPVEFIDRVFDTMEAAERHVFQVLTKRSSLMKRYLHRRYGRSKAPRHIWCGVSVEDRAATARILHLQASPTSVRFLSIEPLHGPVERSDLRGIPWVIFGGDMRTEGPADGSALGHPHPGSLPARERRLLLQAVGRADAESGRPHPRRHRA